MPDLKTGEIHWDAKHDKQGPFSADAFENLHAQVCASHNAVYSTPNASQSCAWFAAVAGVHDHNCCFDRMSLCCRTLHGPWPQRWRHKDPFGQQGGGNGCVCGRTQAGGVTTQGVAIRGSTKKGKGGW